ncbi:MAG: 30S ribosome-binding factor RbfA [Clostridia bacterium]|nr:30S ribosome-binding factor RbfA [Clostridia bacterium]
MAGFKINRVSSDIKLCLSELLREVKDPRVSKLISIVKLDVSGDMSYATVYVSAIEGAEKTRESVKALNKSACGFLRRELGARMKLRKVPELKFIADDSIEKSSEILAMLNSLKMDEIKEGDNGEQ